MLQTQQLLSCIEDQYLMVEYTQYLPFQQQRSEHITGEGKSAGTHEVVLRAVALNVDLNMGIENIRCAIWGDDEQG